MSDFCRDLLLVGSGLEAQLALREFSQFDFGGKIFHLPTPPNPLEYLEFTEAGLYSNMGTPAPDHAVLRDTWGKNLVTLKLPPLVALEPFKLSEQLPGVERLAAGNRVKKVHQVDSDVCATLTDGSEIVCQGVLFADGLQSQSQLFWTKPALISKDPLSTRCWSFTTTNLLKVQSWEFRWALAKSLEIVPTSNNTIRVRLRFRSPFGGKLTVAELQDLFLEFGTDISALFENVEPEQITLVEEQAVVQSVHTPAVGCLALGSAAWAGTPLLTFDWRSQQCRRQLAILSDQLRTHRLSPESFQAQAIEDHTLAQKEIFLRKHLHYDNVFVRPFRDLLLKFVPRAYLKTYLQKWV